MIDFDTYLSWQIIGALFGTFVLFPLCLLWIKHRHSKSNKNNCAQQAGAYQIAKNDTP